jgi:hypothetical protein
MKIQVSGSILTTTATVKQYWSPGRLLKQQEHDETSLIGVTCTLIIPFFFQNKKKKESGTQRAKFSGESRNLSLHGPGAAVYLTYAADGQN